MMSGRDTRSRLSRHVCDIIVRNPRMNDGGLLLASTATHNPLPDCALASMAATSPWERTPKIDGSMTSYQFLLTVAEPLACKKPCDRPRVFYPDMAFLPGTRPRSPEKNVHRRT